MHLDGRPTRSCITPVVAAKGKKVTTLAGLGTQDKPHPLQKAFIAEQVPQCGYCQSGQVMSATALLNEIPKPSNADIDRAMAGNVCRCATYVRIRAAIHEAAKNLKA